MLYKRFVPNGFREERTVMLTKKEFDERLTGMIKEQETLIRRPNPKTDFYNGIYDRYENPVLTAEHAPIIWRYDLSHEDNPNLMERLGVNAVMNSGAVYLNGKSRRVAGSEPAGLRPDGGPGRAAPGVRQRG